MKSYTTVSMDTWDIISKKVYGDEHYIDKLRKLFKKPRCKPDGTKLFRSVFLYNVKKWCFFCHQNSIILLC